MGFLVLGVSVDGWPGTRQGRVGRASSICVFVFVNLRICICAFVFVYLELCICICAFVFVYLELCICICVFGFGSVDGRSDRGEGRQGVSQEAITFYSISYSKHFHHHHHCILASSSRQYVIIISLTSIWKSSKKSRKFVFKSKKLSGLFCAEKSFQEQHNVLSF